MEYVSVNLVALETANNHSKPYPTNCKTASVTENSLESSEIVRAKRETFQMKPKIYAMLTAIDKHQLIKPKVLMQCLKSAGKRIRQNMVIFHLHAARQRKFSFPSMLPLSANDFVAEPSHDF